ncbi:gamma-glutamyltranspeptidase [Stipitochalara longipes BDJ]|nr:gamma-glutamyltranspeptidase [Stipitochalara longipes BDJ]
MASLYNLIKHASRGLLWLLLLDGHFVTAAPAHGTDSFGAVSSESKTCSEIGIELLRRGGNAADAMVGTTLCVGVIGMVHSGVGGGGFMLIRDSDGNYEAIDFRETAPAAASEDMYNDNVRGSLRGGLASGVPGDLRGLEYLHKKHGILPWKIVCNPAVHVARHGFRVTEDLVRYMHAGHHHGAFLVEDPQWAIDFAPNGTLVGVGDMITRKRYANTLERIADYGADIFYEGEIANYTINAVQAAGGVMTLDDLKNYKVAIRNPISITYKDFTLHSCGAPSGGSVALSILKILEGYETSDPELRNLSYHRLNEAMRFSYAARNELGDPDFFGYMSGFEAQMLRQSTVERIRKRISDHHTYNVSHYSPVKYSLPENHGTSHIVTTDASGISITLTSTVNLLWGSLLVVPETGVIMNDEMNDFSIPGIPNEFGFSPSPINYIAPLKRPLSSISPIIVEHTSNRSLYISIGAAGGSMIPTSTVQSIWHVLEHDMTLPQALKAPRMHDQLLPAITLFEDSFDKDIVQSLGERGHNLTFTGNHMASVQGVRRLWNGTFEAASEPRQLNSGGLAV